MRRLLISSALALALVAYAGTRARDTSTLATITTDPTDAGDGVSLSEITGCRASVRALDGGNVNGGTVRYWYYDAVNGWVPSNAAFDCTLESNRRLDGGAPTAQVCPDLEPAAKFGRIAVRATGLAQNDAGAMNPVVRIECFGPTLP